jgi:hypothetical protein
VPLSRPSSFQDAPIGLSGNSLLFGTPPRTRTGTILLLRETPHTNWARGAYVFGASGRTRTCTRRLIWPVLWEGISFRLYQLSYRGEKNNFDDTDYVAEVEAVLFGAPSEIRTHGFRVLQTLALGLSATGAY